jgi:hypothetical protein
MCSKQYGHRQFPVITPPHQYDHGYLSTKTHQPIPLTIHHTDPEWEQSFKRYGSATSKRLLHGRLVPPTYRMFPIVFNLQVNLSKFKFPVKNAPNVENVLVDKWSKVAVGYTSCTENGRALLIDEPDPMFPSMSIFGKYINPLHCIVKLCAATQEDHKRTDLECVQRMFRNYVFTVVKQHWLLMNKRFLQYTGVDRQVFDVSLPPFIYCMLHSFDFKYETQYSSCEEPLKIFNSKISLDKLATEHTLTNYFLLILWRLHTAYYDSVFIPNKMSWFDSNFIKYVGDGTMKTNTSKIYTSCRYRELPYDSSQIINELRDKLGSQLTQSKISTSKEMSQHALGFRVVTTRIEDKRVANFHTHHFMTPIHPILDLSVYSKMEHPQWAQMNVMDIIQPDILMKQVKAYTEMDNTAQTLKIQRQSVLSQFIRIETRYKQDYLHPDNLHNHHHQINHLMLQILRFTKESHISHLVSLYNIDGSDDQYETYYFTLGTDRILHSAWIHHDTKYKINQLFGVNPHLERMGNSSIFVRPVWCLNNYNLTRFKHEITNVSECNGISNLFSTSLDSNQKNKFKTRQLDQHLYVRLLYKRTHTLEEYEIILLKWLYHFTQEPKPFCVLSDEQLFNLFRSLLLLTGNHAVTLRTIVAHYGQGKENIDVLLHLQRAERLWFEHLKDTTLRLVTNNVHYDGEHVVSVPSMKIDVGHLLYLFPLFYVTNSMCRYQTIHNEVDGLITFNSFIGWDDSGKILPTTKIMEDVIVQARSTAFRLQLKHLLENRHLITSHIWTTLKYMYVCIESVDTSMDYDFDTIKLQLQDILTTIKIEQ